MKIDCRAPHERHNEKLRRKNARPKVVPDLLQQLAAEAERFLDKPSRDPSHLRNLIARAKEVTQWP